ncbi:MAG: hypothetical protein H0U78_04255 [Rickettsiaceae bacterium]|nr:hypothetical protein [Rickettsiaceae bacterium]
MSKKSTCFNNAQVYDRSIAVTVISFLLLLGTLPEGGKFLAVAYLFASYFLTHIWCFIHDLIPALKKRFDSVERVYEGNFDCLLREMYAAGLELKNQIGNRYIFTTKYFIFENEIYLVQEQENICTVRSTRRCISRLEKCFSLREKNYIENL